MLYDDTEITYDQANVNYEGSWSLIVADDSTLTETITRFIQHLIAETSTITAAIAKFIRTTIPDAFSLAETLSKKIATVLSETSNITESITKFISTSFAETASLTETIVLTIRKIVYDIPSFAETMTFNIFERLKNAIGIIKEFVRIGKKEERSSVLTADVWDKEALNDPALTYDQSDVSYDSPTAFYNDFIASAKPMLKLTTKQELISLEKKEDKPRILGD